MTTVSTSRGRSALAVSAVFTSLATFLVLIRIYTRAVMVKQMGADDYAIIVSLVRISEPPGGFMDMLTIITQMFSWVFFGLFVGGQYRSILP